MTRPADLKENPVSHQVIITIHALGKVRISEVSVFRIHDLLPVEIFVSRNLIREMIFTLSSSPTLSCVITVLLAPPVPHV